jgi:hypothetical protein
MKTGRSESSITPRIERATSGGSSLLKTGFTTASGSRPWEAMIDPMIAPAIAMPMAPVIDRQNWVSDVAEPSRPGPTEF